MAAKRFRCRTNGVHRGPRYLIRLTRAPSSTTQWACCAAPGRVLPLPLRHTESSGKSSRSVARSTVLPASAPCDAESSITSNHLTRHVASDGPDGGTPTPAPVRLSNLSAVGNDLSHWINRIKIICFTYADHSLSFETNLRNGRRQPFAGRLPHLRRRTICAFRAMCRGAVGGDDLVTRSTVPLDAKLYV